MQTTLKYSITSDSGVGFEHTRVLDAPAYDVASRSSFTITPNEFREVIADGVLGDGRESTIFHNKSKDEQEIKIYTDGGVFHISIPANSFFNLSNVKIALSTDGTNPGANLQLGKVEAISKGAEAGQLVVIILQA